VTVSDSVTGVAASIVRPPGSAGVNRQGNHVNYGYVIPTGYPLEIADLAAEAEAAGWDGAFYWDGIDVSPARPVFDPWVVMTAMAIRTSRVRLGAIISPLSRRRPWKVARETISLDHVSAGRLVLPVGLGAVNSFGAVGEEADRRTRAELLDESLDILQGLWSGEPFSYTGRHYQLGEMTFVPPPVQRPRVPIWPIGAWPYERSMRRAVRYDGVIIEPQGEELSPDLVRKVAEWVAEHRASDGPFDLIVSGTTQGDDPDAAGPVDALADAGATWWLEEKWEEPNDVDVVRARIRQGPPRQR